MSLQSNQISNNYSTMYNKNNIWMSSNAIDRTSNSNNIDNEQKTNKSQGGSKSAKLGDYVCQTCKNRKYVDGSDDPGVSFKTPTSISPGNAFSAVMAHEGEHVARESSKAQAEDKKIVSQSVRIFTSICPECGKPYISGGLTKTTTKTENRPKDSNYGQYIDVYA